MRVTPLPIMESGVEYCFANEGGLCVLRLETRPIIFLGLVLAASACAITITHILGNTDIYVYCQ